MLWMATGGAALAGEFGSELAALGGVAGGSLIAVLTMLFKNRGTVRTTDADSLWKRMSATLDSMTARINHLETALSAQHTECQHEVAQLKSAHRTEMAAMEVARDRLQLRVQELELRLGQLTLSDRI